MALNQNLDYTYELGNSTSFHVDPLIKLSDRRQLFLIKKAKIDEGGRLHGAKIKLCVTLGKTPRQTATMVKGVGKLPKVS